MTTITTEPAPAQARRAGIPSIDQLRYGDLKRARIVSTHAQLKKRIEEEGFPPGRWIGPNVRAWTVQEVEQWLASRPTTRPDTPAIKVRKRQVRRQRRAQAAA